MTSEEFRSNPMFLRNQFNGIGVFEMPLLQKHKHDLKDVKLLGYDKTKQGDTENKDKYIHFFLDDYKFESLWKDPEPRLEKLLQYKGVLTPQYSIYTEMPLSLHIYNIFRSRWVGAWFQSRGVPVIPTVYWGMPQSYWFCFDGIEKGSTVAISMIGIKKEKDFFLQGYHEMQKRIEPEAIICYGDPFDEMEGKIIPIDYAETNHLTPVQNKSADATKIRKTTGRVLSLQDEADRVKLERESMGHIKCFSGHVESKGGGFSSGGGNSRGNPKPGEWKPKKEDDERFFGKPGETKTTYDKNGNRRDTKIGDNGKATQERHHTDHGHPKNHSNPHDHMIKYNPDGSPDWGNSEQINYFGVDIPKLRRNKGGAPMSDNRPYDYETLLEKGCLEPSYSQDQQFHSLEEFQHVMDCHAEVVFVYHKQPYSLTYIKNTIIFAPCYYEGDDDLFDTQEQVLDQILDGKKLRDIVTEIQVIERYDR